MDASLNEDYVEDAVKAYPEISSQFINSLYPIENENEKRWNKSRFKSEKVREHLFQLTGNPYTEEDGKYYIWNDVELPKQRSTQDGCGHLYDVELPKPSKSGIEKDILLGISIKAGSYGGLHDFGPAIDVEEKRRTLDANFVMEFQSAFNWKTFLISMFLNRGPALLQYIAILATKRNGEICDDVPVFKCRCCMTGYKC